jgi:hypothetical protein
MLNAPHYTFQIIFGHRRSRHFSRHSVAILVTIFSMTRKRESRKLPDAVLFKDTPHSVKALHKLAKTGLRLKARARWWAVKQAQEQAQQQGQTPDYNEE